MKGQCIIAPSEMTTLFVDYVIAGNTAMDFGRTFIDVAAF